MKFANKYKLVSATDQQTALPVPLPPQETARRNYERAATALVDNIHDRSLPSDVALENHAFLRDNYMESLNRIMKDRNQIVDRLDAIARLISLNVPAGNVPAPLAGIRGAWEMEEPVQRERTPPPFEEHAEKIPEAPRRKLPVAPPRRLELERTPATGRRRPTTKTTPDAGPTRGAYLRQDRTKLSPLVLRRAGIKGWATKKK